MNHKSSAKTHVYNRFLERYGKRPTLKDIDKIRIALITGNDCFLRMFEDDKIRGIVKYENIHVTAVYSKKINGLLTVGCPLLGSKK